MSDKTLLFLDKSDSLISHEIAKMRQYEPKRLTSSVKKININTCNIEELLEIPGIGETLSERIIISRPYATLDDISNVKGIGKDKLHNIKNLCIV